MGNRLKMFADIMACHSGVAGSCFFCSVRIPAKEKNVRFLVDFGLFQGLDEEKECKGDFDKAYLLNSELLFDPNKVDFVLVTHNHVDHTGRLPMLVRNGFTGNIYTSEITKTLLPIALYDSEKILTERYKKLRKKPIYLVGDVNETLSRVVGCEFAKKIQITENIEVTFIENSHIPGAAMILVEISCENEEPINLLFSGDYASYNDFVETKELPEEIKEKRISALMCESTYGTTCTEDIERGRFKRILLDELQKGKKNILLPTLALQRTQQILYELKKLQDSGELDETIPIYLDGKLSQKYTRVYLEGDIIKEEMKNFLPKNLTWVYKDTRGEVLLNEKKAKIIVTSSGMGTYGAARRYISYFCGKNNSSIIFNCFLPNGTTGRTLMQTKKGEKANIYGLIKEINFGTYATEEFSSHAKQDELLDFLKKFKNLRSVIINHGEEDVKEKFAKVVYDEVDTRSVGIIDRDYLFRIGAYGIEKTIPTKFTR